MGFGYMIQSVSEEKESGWWKVCDHVGLAALHHGRELLALGTIVCCSGGVDHRRGLHGSRHVCRIAGVGVHDLGASMATIIPLSSWATFLNDHFWPSSWAR